MRTIIAGSRGITDTAIVAKAVKASKFKVTLVISGAARGVDRLGEQWANLRDLPVERYHADWDMHGRAAGYIRNNEMASVANALIAIWDGKSRGTAHMIRLAERWQLKVFVWRTDERRPRT